MFSVTLETMCPEDTDFQLWLFANNVKAELTGDVHAQPGGGEDVVYTAIERAALERLILNFWECGDSEVDAELYASIKAV